jgi:hypothetical protein
MSKEVKQVVALQEMAYQTGVKEGREDYTDAHFGFTPPRGNGFSDAQTLGGLAEEVIPGCGNDVPEWYNKGYKVGAEIASMAHR